MTPPAPSALPESRLIYQLLTEHPLLQTQLHRVCNNTNALQNWSDRLQGMTGRGLKVGGLNGTNQDFGSTPMLATPSNWTWKSPPHFTNSSSIPPGHPSGLVPGLIAAGIFIMFLLCLYAILWKCMVSPPHKKRRKRGPTDPQKLLVV